MPHEVVTFGEAMVRLSPPDFRRLEQARSLDVQVGGAELNTAVGLARLGRSTAWVSRLTDNPLGRLIANHAREAGVSHRSRRLDAGGPRRRLLPGVRRRSARQQRPLRPQGSGHRQRPAGHGRLGRRFSRREMVPRHRHHAGPQPDRRRDDARSAAGRQGRRTSAPASTSIIA